MTVLGHQTPVLRTITVTALRIVLIAAVVMGVWQGVVTVTGAPHYMLPPPLRVLATIGAEWPYLMRHAGTTAIEILLGLAFGAAFGVATALVMILFTAARRLVLPFLIISQALPVFAIAPILVLWFGYGLASKVVMAALIIYFPVASATYDGLARTDPGLLDLANLWRAGRLQRLALIRFPAALPSLASGVRVAATVAPIGAIVGEWVGASAGLGFVMLHAVGRMQTDRMFAALLILGAMALVLRFAVDFVLSRLLPWISEHHGFNERTSDD